MVGQQSVGSVESRGQVKFFALLLLVGMFVVFVGLVVVFGGLALVVDSSGDAGASSTDAATPMQTTSVTAVPTESQTHGSTPTSTVSRTPSLTPTATRTPSPTATPTLTPSPTSTPTATPAPTPAPDEESYSYAGNGGDVTDSFETAGGLVTFDLEHDGDENFIVWLVSDDGEQEELVANHIGSYDGTYAMYLPPGEYQLDIDADGDWSAGIEQPRYSVAEIESLPDEASDTHSAYTGPYQFEDTTEVTIEVENEEHVAVWLARHDGRLIELLSNDIGPYEETTLVTDDGIGMLIVRTDGGEWSLEVGE